MNAILLYPRDGAQFRLGEGSLEESGDMLHSDTLFSALANIYALAFNKADNFIQFVQEGKLRFSSALFGLHFLKENQRVYFVPKPNLDFTQTERKKAKKVKFISLKALEIISERTEKEKLESEIDLDAFHNIGGKFLLETKEAHGYNLKEKNFISITTAPKVFVRKEVKEDNYYHESNLQFCAVEDNDQPIANGFFYILLDHQLSEDEFKEFQAAIRILADEGIGGSRSTGCGQIKHVDFTEISVPKTGTLHLGLALVSPKDDQEFQSSKRYELILRGGGSLGKSGDYSKHRKLARFIREGAIYNVPVQGKLVDLSPDENPFPHRILRNGINFSIPF
ncbi:MAG: type III-A CRISPR-associated RAMP protein Csm4 [Candidatus Thermochlorobacter sp.]